MHLLSLLDRSEQTQYLILQEFLKAEEPLTIADLQQTITGTKSFLSGQLKKLQSRSECYPALHWEQTDSGWLFYKDTDFKLTEFYYDYLQETVNYQLLIKLYQEGQLDPAVTMHEFYMSDATYFRRIKQLNQILLEFHIKIKNGRLQGDELQIRYFFYQLFLKAVPYADTVKANKDPVIKELMEGIQEAFQMQLQPFEYHSFFLILRVFRQRWSTRNDHDHLPIKELIPLLEEEPTYQLLREHMAKPIKKSQWAWIESECGMLYIFLHSFHILPHDLPFFAADYQRFDDGLLLPIEGNLINRTCQALYLAFSERFVGTPLKQDDQELIRYVFIQMAYFLTFFKSGYLNYETEEYVSLKNVVVLEKLQIGAEMTLREVYEQLSLPFDMEDSHTRLMYNRFLALFINIYQRHPLPLLMGFNYQGWPLARDTLRRYLQDMMLAQHVVVEDYRSGQKYDMVVTNQEDPEISENSYATFLISDVITDKEMHSVMNFISYRREHFYDFERILPYL